MDNTERTQPKGQYDKYDLYTLGLQTPVLEARYLASLADGPHLREDFCGTAAISRSWIALSQSRTATAVDMDSIALSRAARSLERAEPPSMSTRIQFANADATEFRSRDVDVLTVPNSSIFLVTDRQRLRRYLEHVWHDLNEGGAIAIDMFGGPSALGNGTTVVDCDGFRCIWQQEDFDFRTHIFDAHVRFQTRGHSPIASAFSYRMRLWSAPEVVDMLIESGFERTTVSIATTRNSFFNGRTMDANEDTGSDEWEQFIVGYKPAQS